jgi:hypothetical protein
MAKAKQQFKVKKEGDVYSKGFKLQIRKDTPQAKLAEFYNKFAKTNYDYVASFLIIDTDEVQEETTD